MEDLVFAGEFGEFLERNLVPAGIELEQGPKDGGRRQLLVIGLFEQRQHLILELPVVNEQLKQLLLGDGDLRRRRALDLFSKRIGPNLAALFDRGP